MDELLTVKQIMEDYSLSRRKADEIRFACKTAPRKKNGKIFVLRSEFEKALKSGRMI